MEKTTIKLTKSTKKKLEELKIYPRETYEEVITRLINHYSVEINTFNPEEVNQQIKEYLNNLKNTPEDNGIRSRILFELSR